MPTPVDHILIALIALGFPAYWKIEWRRRFRSRLATSGTPVRLAAYREAILEQWLLTAAVLFYWIWQARVVADLGLGIPGGWPFWAGAAVAIGFAIFLWRQLVMVRASEEARAQTRRQLQGDVALIIPRSDAERRWFVGLSLTAGFCEEALYRAFLIWYLTVYLPLPVAVALSAVAFGAAHAYLGWRHVLQTAVVGVIFALAYLLTGSLWIPIALHATIDIMSGFTGSVALEESAAF